MPAKPVAKVSGEEQVDDFVLRETLQIEREEKESIMEVLELVGE